VDEKAGQTTSPSVRWEARSGDHLIALGGVRALAQAIEDDNPLWWDADAALRLGYQSQPAPPMLIDSFNPFYAGEPYPVDSPLPHRFSAGDEFVFHRPICVGDVIEARCRIGERREGLRSDGSSRMLFVTYDKSYLDAHGDLVAEAKWTCVHFEGDSAARTSGSIGPPEWATVALAPEEREISPTQIVRWTCATGDFERIHIDYRYATEERGLRDVVGHGPYTAAVLLKLITDHVGDPGRLCHAAFRYRGSVYPGDRITFAGWRRAGSDATAGEAFLVASNQDGAAVTTGTCGWGAAEAPGAINGKERS
jgi:acyl dehydratase